MTIAAKVAELSKVSAYSKIKYPIPWLLLINSAAKAPIKASAVDILRAEKRYGRELGSLSLRKICHFEAEKDLNIVKASASTVSSPLRVLTKRGKKQTSITIAILEIKPIPSHSTKSGAKARIGIVLSTISWG